jgi:hypothetical protein
MQSTSVAQVDGHVAEEPEQTYGAQGGVPGAPAERFTHLPAAPGALHVSHAPVQADSQQTPSTQLTVAHSFAAPQPVPLILSGTHFPLEQ